VQTLETTPQTITDTAPVVVARQPRRLRVLDIAGPLFMAAVFITVWWLISESLPDGKNGTRKRDFLVPSPIDVWRKGFANHKSRTEIWNAGYQTLRESLTGLVIAGLIGIGLAVLMSQARWVERSVFPWVVALQTIPILALVPFIKVRYGVEFKSRVIVCVLIAVFPIITNTLFGLRSADEGHHDLFTLHHASRRARLRKLQLPGALPAMFTGFRISSGLSVVGAIVGEYFFRSGKTALGHLIEKYRARPDTYPQLFATIIVICGLGVMIFVAFSIVSSFVTKSWYEPASASHE
jgi:NitT/TauT family transport system permease protein